jgi:hypothetical protein
MNKKRPIPEVVDKKKRPIPHNLCHSSFFIHPLPLEKVPFYSSTTSGMGLFYSSTTSLRCF